MFVAGPCTNQPRFADGRVADEDTFYQLLVGLLVVHASIGGTIPHFWNDCSSSGLAAAAALSKTLRFPANSPLFCIISATSELGSRLAATRVLDFFFLQTCSSVSCAQNAHFYPLLGKLSSKDGQTFSS